MEASDATALIDRHFDEVRKFFANAVDDDAREDLTQETFLRLMKALPNFEGRSSFRTYLFKIAHNTLYDYLRKKYKGRGKFDPLEHSVIDHGGVRPSYIIAEIDRYEALLACLRALPVETKELLELYYWHGLTGRELAEFYGLASEASAHGRLGAARKRLRACLVHGAQPPRPDVDLEEQLRKLGEFFDSVPPRDEGNSLCES